MRKLGVAVLVIAAALCLSGCSSGAPSAQGTWGDRGEAGAAYLELLRGGVVTGSDGCNTVHSSWEQSGSKVSFGPFASTMIACTHLHSWVTRAATATVSGSSLIVYSAAHERIGTLTKHGS